MVTIRNEERTGAEPRRRAAGPRWRVPAPQARALLAGLLLLGASGAGLSAQELPLKTAEPQAAALVCAPQAVGEPRPLGRVAEPAEAGRLINAATQAMLLGDLDGALDFLDRALAVDPSAAEAEYLRARILQRREEPDAATEALCRYLRIAPDGPSASEVRRRLQEALEQGAGQSILAAYRRGLDLEREGRTEEAEAAFTEVVSARPQAAIALYNRGVIRNALGRDAEARADLERYLALEPAAPDAAQVRQFLGDRPGRLAATAGPTSGAAFALGALLPGGGQFYTGRPGFGAAVTAIAGGALAAGLLYERTTIQCRDALATECPEELIAGRETDRPLLVPAIGVAAGVALAAAVEAALHARGRRAAPAPRGAGPSVQAPRLQYDGSALQLELVRLDF